MTNLLASIVVSIVTNWTPVYEQLPWYQSFSNFSTDIPEPKQGKYLGEDGAVVEVTEIRFDYQGPRVMRIEKPLKKIIRRCTERPVAPVREWEPEIVEEIGVSSVCVTNNIQSIDITGVLTNAVIELKQQEGSK
jgi:hypothetical protein